MYRKEKIITLLVGLFATIFLQQAYAGITVYKDGDKYVKIGGRIQLQYHSVDADDGDSTTKNTISDEVFFRRLRPYIEGSLYKDWKGKFQWDMGKAEGTNEIAVKDAYFQYKGIKNHKLTFGNANFAFSREFLTTSKKQQLVERTFVGDHNYGTPDKNTGIHFSGHAISNMLNYAASFAAANIDPDDKKLDFDTPVNANDDFNQGWMTGARFSVQPLGKVKFSQGDFSGKPRVDIAVAGFSWVNDNDNNTYTDPVTGIHLGGSKVDVDSVVGTEVSLAFRGWGLSADAQHNIFTAKTVDNTYTGGIYENGDSRLSNTAMELGYMVWPKTIELVAGQQSMKADTYQKTWTRTSGGINWFLHGHDIKIQATYRQGKNLDGVKNNNANEMFVQGQYVF